MLDLVDLSDLLDLVDLVDLSDLDLIKSEFSDTCQIVSCSPT